MPSREILQMVQTIERECDYCRSLTGLGKIRPEVLQAMTEVPRENFVPPHQRPFAYADRALPIGEGQTISQPFIVALMTDLLVPDPTKVMLEIGTGSGYQAAVLSRLVKQVFSIEVVPRLAAEAAERLRHLGFANITVHAGDGYLGWPEQAPFDGIIVTAAVSHVPPPLVAQLKPGAHLVLPLGLPNLPQELVVVEKGRDGSTHTREVLGVAFVPLTGGHAVPGNSPER